MAKAIVLEIKGNRATVLVDGGEFREVKVDQVGFAVGQEIRVPDARQGWALRLLPSFGRTRMAIMAMVLIAVLMPFGYFQMVSPGPVMAYVGLDINPSFELGVDAKLRVAQVRPVGNDAAELLPALKWKGRQLAAVVADAVKASGEKGYMASDAENSVILTVIPKEAALSQGTEQKIDALAKEIEAAIKKTPVKTSVSVVRGDADLKKAADALGISTGRAAVLLEAVSQGVEISPDDIKTQKISKAVPKAGGKLTEILGKAEKQKDWAKLVEIQKAQAEKKAQKQEQKEEKKDTKATPAKQTTPAKPVPAKPAPAKQAPPAKQTTPAKPATPVAPAKKQDQKPPQKDTNNQNDSKKTK